MSAEDNWMEPGDGLMEAVDEDLSKDIQMGW